MGEEGKVLLLLGKNVEGVEEGVGVEVDKHVCGGLVGEEEEISVWCDPFDPCG